VIIVIHVVDPGVGVGWLLEQAGPPSTTEWLCPLSPSDFGWCTTADLRDAQVAGPELIGEMKLRHCEVLYEQYHGRLIAAVRCGEFALVTPGNPDLDLAGVVTGLALLVAWAAPPGQMGWTSSSELLTALSGRGPMPKPRPTPVIRGCAATVAAVICGWWAKLPPLPAPCPNPNLVTHDFV
jgi:hypothetical protein